MTRLLNNLIKPILVLTAIGRTNASEPHLRNTNKEHTKYVVGSDEENRVLDGHRSGTIHFEKGMKCSGKFERDYSDAEELDRRRKGANGMHGRRCEGGMKAEFEGEATPENMANEVTQILTGQMKEAMAMPNPNPNPDGSSMEDLLYPSKEDMETLMMELDGLQDGEKTFQFGGIFEAKWGCNVTISGTGDREDGTFTKTVECGFSRGGGKGRKSAGIDFFEAVE